MKNLNLNSASDMSFYESQIPFVDEVTQLRSRHSSIGTTQTRQAIEPFDLNDVARAFDGSLASHFKHLEDQSQD